MSATVAEPKARSLMTVDEFCEELQIARSTFNDWRAKKRGPKCVKLPNGQLRIRHSEFEKFLKARES